MSALPGKTYLRPFFAERGEKCSCKSPNMMMPSGAWVVEHEKKFYTFDPQTQLQKDIWLGVKGANTTMLRWYCFSCKTVQTP